VRDPTHRQPLERLDSGPPVDGGELAARAARSGRSLQEYLAAELAELAARPDASTVAAARSRLRATGRVLDPEVIVADRDADRA
jgi:hypothetical protein